MRRKSWTLKLFSFVIIVDIKIWQHKTLKKCLGKNSKCFGLTPVPPILLILECLKFRGVNQLSLVWAPEDRFKKGNNRPYIIRPLEEFLSLSLWCHQDQSIPQKSCLILYHVLQMIFQNRFFTVLWSQIHIIYP